MSHTKQPILPAKIIKDYDAILDICNDAALKAALYHERVDKCSFCDFKQGNCLTACAFAAGKSFPNDKIKRALAELRNINFINDDSTNILTLEIKIDKAVKILEEK